VRVGRLGISHTPVESQHFYFQSCARHKQSTLQAGRLIRRGVTPTFLEGNCRQDLLKVLFCFIFLEDGFQMSAQDSSEVARRPNGYCGMWPRVWELAPFTHVEFLPLVWYQICSQYSPWLLGRMLESPASEGTGRYAIDRSAIVSPHHFSLFHHNRVESV
jgi:hypothetical protein